MPEVNSRKAAIIGCGFVGASSAFALMQSSLFSELVLLDADRSRAEGEALDISHGLAFAKPMQIHVGDYDECLCAGQHVARTGQIGRFRITSSRWQDGVQRLVFRLDETHEA